MIELWPGGPALEAEDAMVVETMSGELIEGYETATFNVWEMLETLCAYLGFFLKEGPR